MRAPSDVCLFCGTPLEFAVADLLDGAPGRPSFAPQCVACLAQQVASASGNLVFRSPPAPPLALYPLGRLVITREAVGALAAAGHDVAALLARHGRLHGLTQAHTVHRTASGYIVTATTALSLDGLVTTIALRRAG